jgi:response regulator RpfG family c-di-GMP phosphodiesterase
MKRERLTEAGRNVIVQYSTVMLLLVVAVTVAGGVALADRARDLLVETRVELYPELVSHETMDHPSLYAFLEEGEPQRNLPDEVRPLVDHFEKISDASRIKIWDRDLTVLWSDDPDAVGKRFPDNHAVRGALEGEVRYELGQPEEAENVTEQQLGTVLELYVPVWREGRPVGVLEFYTRDEALAREIEHQTRLTWGSMAVAAAVLYGLLFLIFYRAHQRQRETQRQLQAAHDATVFSLAYQAELRDQQTGRHLERTALYVRTLAEALASTGKYRGYVTEDYIADLVKAAPLHDIGKVAVPDSILQKPGKLTSAEFEQIKLHTEYGARTIHQIERGLQFESFLRIAAHITRHHHERWDGTGYPDGLSGEEIPLSARIMAFADVYDALRSTRPYKEAMSHEQSVELIVAERGTHFDPMLVDIFRQNAEAFRVISDAEDAELEERFRSFFRF